MFIYTNKNICGKVIFPALSRKCTGFHYGQLVFEGPGLLPPIIYMTATCPPTYQTPAA